MLDISTSLPTTSLTLQHPSIYPSSKPSRHVLSSTFLPTFMSTGTSTQSNTLKLSHSNSAAFYVVIVLAVVIISVSIVFCVGYAIRQRWVFREVSSPFDRWTAHYEGKDQPSVRNYFSVRAVFQAPTPVRREGMQAVTNLTSFEDGDLYSLYDRNNLLGPDWEDGIDGTLFSDFKPVDKSERTFTSRLPSASARTTIMTSSSSIIRNGRAILQSITGPNTDANTESATVSSAANDEEGAISFIGVNPLFQADVGMGSGDAMDRTQQRLPFDERSASSSFRYSGPNPLASKKSNRKQQQLISSSHLNDS
jgi:hypothetical protein